MFESPALFAGLCAPCTVLELPVAPPRPPTRLLVKPGPRVRVPTAPSPPTSTIPTPPFASSSPAPSTVRACDVSRECVGLDAAPLAGLVVADETRAAAALPPFVPRRAGAACHLWLAPGAVASAPHCDEDHNVLTVLRGRKTVALAPPKSGGAACAVAPPWAAAPNHGARHLGDAPRISLGAGEALLLPAGWYHAVESAPGTVAVNAWWRPRKDARAGARVDAAARALRAAGREDPRRDFFDRRALVQLCAARRRRDLGAPASRGDRARARFARFARCVDGALRAAFGLGAGPPLAGLAALPDGALAAALATAGPRAAAALAALWDRDADACDALLGRLGAEARETAKARLRRGRDAFARASGRRLLRRLAARARRRAARARS